MTRWLRFAADRRWRDWLAYPGSLTRRIVERSRSFRVEVARQGTRLPNADEWRALGLPRRELAHVREVALLADGRPVVIGHSIVAMREVHGPWRSIAGLGTRPLAAVLFADRRVRRAPFEFAAIDRRHPLWWRAVAIAGPQPRRLPARRSVFRRASHAVMVTEVFLPAARTLKR